MKKITALLLVLVLLVGAFAACGGGGSSSSTSETPPAGGSSETTPSDPASVVPVGDRVLNLYTWQGMFPDDVLKDFTAETGIKINYSNFDTDEAMLAKLKADKTGSYDLVIANDYIVKTAIAENLLTKLDKDKLSNFGNIDPVYQGRFFDPTDEYTVPYGAGVQTIVYNPAKVDVAITSYEDLWNPAFANQIGIIGNPRVINGMVLKTMGESYNTQDVGVITSAGEKLNLLAPNIRTITDDNLQDKMITGEISVGIMYTSQVTLAKTEMPELQVVFPTEGIGFGIMPQFIPANAPHPDEAYEFMNYILRPEVSAKCFEFMGYYNTNKAAQELISDQFKELLSLPEGFATNMEMIEPISAEAEEAHNLIWTQFQAAR